MSCFLVSVIVIEEGNSGISNKLLQGPNICQIGCNPS